MPHPIHATRVKQHVVMPGFFAERGLEFVAGGGFAPGDDGPDQVVINEAYARAHFQDPPVIGKGVNTGGIAEGWYEVVGVVRDGSGGGLGASGSPYSVYYSAFSIPRRRWNSSLVRPRRDRVGLEDFARGRRGPSLLSGGDVVRKGAGGGRGRVRGCTGRGLLGSGGQPG